MNTVLDADTIKRYLSISPPLVQGLIDQDVQTQSNGIDLTLREVREFRGPGHLDFSNKHRVLPSTSLIDFDPDGWVSLNPGSYLVSFNEVVNLPLSLMALGKPRSSLLRMGATVETAVWDAGYRGRSQCLLVVHNQQGLRLARNARILQLVFFRLGSETEGYSGAYQGENI